MYIQSSKGCLVSLYLTANHHLLIDRYNTYIEMIIDEQNNTDQWLDVNELFLLLNVVSILFLLSRSLILSLNNQKPNFFFQKISFFNK